jgi:methyl-accepting chemotaxis protein
MALRFTIRRRLLAMSLAGLAFVSVLGAVGEVAIGRLSHTRDGITESMVALRANMSADMMHDALRADVLLALLAGSRQDTGIEAEVVQDLHAHSKIFRDSLDTLDAARLEAGTQAAVKALRPALDAYLRAAEEVVSLGWKDNAAAMARWPAFQAAFARLEGEMEGLGDLVEANAKAQRDGSVATSDHAHQLILATGLVAALVLLGVGQWISQSVTRPIESAVRVARAVAEGDLRSRVEVRGNDEISELMRALHAMNESLVEIVGTVRSNSESIATGTGEIASGNSDLCTRTEQQAASLQQTAASMEQISAAVRTSAASARHASELAEAARTAAAHGGAVVGRVTRTMEDIRQGSRRIAEINGVIDGIAFQTNILALNAAVEAAPAGEHGRGFAVVAAEVRGLAQRSAQAAREIKSLIGASVEQVEAGTVLTQEAGTAIAAIVHEAERVNVLIAEISQTSSEQGRGFEQINQAMSDLDRNTQQNAAAVEQTAAAAESLSRQTQALVDAVRGFKLAAA